VRGKGDLGFLLCPLEGSLKKIVGNGKPFGVFDDTIFSKE
jgi:hypothetical protein